jgi:hypothetical protein
MAQSIDAVLDDLRLFIEGRDNVDFSPWVGLRLVKNDTLALAVFKSQRKQDIEASSNKVSMRLDILDVLETEKDVDDEEHNIPFVSLEREVKHQQQEVEHLLAFPFEEYFSNDIRSAKIDLLVALLVGYYGEDFAKVMMPYRLNIKNAKTYLDSYNQSRNKRFELPPELPKDAKFAEFQHELRELALATRLHLFAVFEYSRFGKKPKRLSDMAYTARAAGIDEELSAQILQRSKLITSFSDGTGFVSPEYSDVIAAALDYANKISPVYKDWSSKVYEAIEEKWGTYVYGTNIEQDSYVTRSGPTAHS